MTLTYAQYQLGLHDLKIRKVLIINWDVVRDKFQFSFDGKCQFAMKLPFTKRIVLRISAMFYDPLGVISSLVLQTRLLFKNICNEKLYWDDIIPEKFTKEWSSLLNSLGDINHINIDRYIPTTSNSDDVLELHDFYDALNVAYCAAIYIGFISNSFVVTPLLTAKCRQFFKKNMLFT